MSGEKVVLITGARKGIGRYLAEYYLGKGNVVIGCSRHPSDLEHDSYTHHCLDVTDDRAVRVMLSSIRKQYDRLDVLINNAGIASMNHLLLTPLNTAKNIMAVNFQGMFIVTQGAAKLMQKHGYGRIVNLSSVAVPLHLEGEAVYAASKSAVATLSQILAREVANLGITCNVVGLTPIKTDLIGGVSSEKIDAIVSRLALRRLGCFEDVSNVVDFLIQPESDYITGQIIYLGGVCGY